LTISFLTAEQSSEGPKYGGIARSVAVSGCYGVDMEEDGHQTL